MDTSIFKLGDLEFILKFFNGSLNICNRKFYLIKCNTYMKDIFPCYRVFILSN
jgi:hypothetical protein